MRQMVLSEQDAGKKLPEAMTKCLHTLQLEQKAHFSTQRRKGMQKGARKSIEGTAELAHSVLRLKQHSPAFLAVSNL